MSVSDPGEKIEWRADSEPQKNERVPSSAYFCVSGKARQMATPPRRESVKFIHGENVIPGRGR
jgi:hypothetical protein